MCTGSQFQEDLLSHGGIERVTEAAIDSVEGFVIDDARKIPGISKRNNFKFSPKSITNSLAYLCKGGSRGRVQGVRTPPPPPAEKTCSFLIQLVFYKKNYVVYWC